MKEKIENAIGLVYTVVEALCRLVLIFMVCTVTAQVISRALGGNIKWCEEVMLILLDTGSLFSTCNLCVQRSCNFSSRSTICEIFSKEGKGISSLFQQCNTVSSISLHDPLWIFPDGKDKF